MDVGVIGVGAMGKNHVRVYSELRRVGSVFTYDLNQEANQRIAAQFEAVPCTSMEELLRQTEAVSVCVPTPFHYRVATQVLARGVHLLLEKPICATFKEGEELLQHIPDGLTVGVGHIERFNPIVKEIKQIVRRPLYVEMKRHNPASARISGSSVIEDLMIHDIDIAFQLFFQSHYTLHSAGTSDICTALIRMGEPPLYSVPVFISASRKAAKKTRSIYIEEEDRTIEGNYMTQEITVYRRPDHYDVENQRYVQESLIESVMVNKVEPLKTELSSFLTAVKQGTPFTVTPRQAVQNLKICEEIQAGLTV